MNFERGMLVRSKAGHDKDTCFVILNECGEYLYLSDGEGRDVMRPKRKNKKHVQIIHKKMENPENMTNEAIRYFIKHSME